MEARGWQKVVVGALIFTEADFALLTYVSETTLLNAFTSTYNTYQLW